MFSKTRLAMIYDSLSCQKTKTFSETIVETVLSPCATIKDNTSTVIITTKNLERCHCIKYRNFT